MIFPRARHNVPKLWGCISQISWLHSLQVYLYSVKTWVLVMGLHVVMVLLRLLGSLLSLLLHGERFLLLELSLEVFLVINLFEAGKSGLGSAAALALDQVDPHEVGSLSLGDLLRSQHRESGTLVEPFHITDGFSPIVNGVQELASLPVVAIANGGVMELGAQLSHVVAWHVLLLLELCDTVREGAVVPELALPEVDHVLAHLSLFLFFHVRVEFLPLLVVGEGLFVLFAGGLAVWLGASGGRVVRVG